MECRKVRKGVQKVCGGCAEGVQGAQCMQRGAKGMQGCVSVHK